MSKVKYFICKAIDTEAEAWDNTLTSYGIISADPELLKKTIKEARAIFNSNNSMEKISYRGIAEIAFLRDDSLSDTKREHIEYILRNNDIEEVDYGFVLFLLKETEDCGTFSRLNIWGCDTIHFDSLSSTLIVRVLESVLITTDWLLNTLND
jgi:hypothetical protein